MIGYCACFEKAQSARRYAGDPGHCKPCIASGIAPGLNLSAMSETVGQRIEIESGQYPICRNRRWRMTE